ncbi:hypothetical protein ACS0TY_014709 [Phlomoides rotata]
MGGGGASSSSSSTASNRPAAALVKRYECSTCGKSFESPQALGGHQTGHRNNPSGKSLRSTSSGGPHPSGGNLHRCSTCGKCFSSGQALGGHQRKHYRGGSTSFSLQIWNVTNSDGSNGERWNFDLNAPPSPDDDLDLTLRL